MPGTISIPYAQTLTPDATNALASYKGCKLTVDMGKSSENESRVSMPTFVRRLTTLGVSLFLYLASSQFSLMV